MRLRTFTLPRKSILAATSLAAALTVASVPATAATPTTGPTDTPAIAPASTSLVMEQPGERPVDDNAAYFATIAAGTAKLASGKVSTANLDVQIALLGQSDIMSPADVSTLISQVRANTATVAARVISHDKEQARKAKAAKVAKEKARKAAEARAAAARAAQARAAQARASQSRSKSTSTSQRQGSVASVSGSSSGNSPSAARAFARSYMASAYGWGGNQFTCLNNLWNRESGWNYRAANGSGAYGIPQALPGSKMGAGWQSSATVQVKWGLRYISGRYGTPCGAWSHSQSSGWY